MQTDAPLLASLLAQYRGWCLAAAAVLCALAWWPAQRLEFDRSIENMFPQRDELLGSYRRLKRTFGGDEIALAAYVDPKLLTSAGLERLAALTSQLAEVEGVEQVFSLGTLPWAMRLTLLTGIGPGVRLRDLATGYVLSDDGQTAGVICVLAPEAESPVPRRETVDQLRKLVADHDPSGVLTGEPVMVVDGFRYLEADGQRLGTLATALLMLVIGVSFRSLRWMLVPLAATCAALWWTQALLVVSGLRLSMVSSMLWAIVTVIVVATVMHVVVTFRAQRARGLPPPRALRGALALLVLPIAWACLTDAAGFGSLLVARVAPVSDFGLMMVVGSLLALAAILLIVPGLALLGTWDLDPHRAWGEGYLDLVLSRLAYWIEHHPRRVALAACLPPLVAATGVAWLEVETDFTRNFRRDSPVVEAYEFVETRLGGAGVWDVMVPVPDEIPPDLLARVSRLENRLRQEVTLPGAEGRPEPALTKVLSLADVAALSTPVEQINSTELERLVAALRTLVPVVDALYGSDPLDGNRRWLRVMLRSGERQPTEVKEQLIAQVRRISNEEFPGAEVSGLFVLMARLIDSVSRDQWTTFGLATAGIGLMMLLALQSWRLALVALVPNALPILLVTGLMGWFGWKINMGAAMIAAVSMGLAVDSSIQYITAFRRQRAAGSDHDEAIMQVHHSVGRAMVFSTLALVVGFSSLAVSQFVPTIYFGVLVSLALVGGMAGNLVLLPALLKLLGSRVTEASIASASPAADPEPPVATRG